ncbi:DUF3592 domain-containing protein [Planctomycetes bacterium CA13]
MLDLATSFRMARVMMPILVGCMLLASAIFAIETGSFVRSATCTTGTITASAEMTSDEGDTLYQPTFTFIAAGQQYTVTPRSFVSPSPGDTGDRIAILYDARNPNRARIDAFAYTWAIPVVLLAMSIVFGLLYFGVYWIHRRIRWVTPDGG